MPLPCVPIPMKGTFRETQNSLGRCQRVGPRLTAGGGQRLRCAPVTVHPLVCTGGYNFDLLQDNSTAIEVEFIPQCSGEAAASPSIWEWVPISSSAQYIPYTVTSDPNNVVVLTYDCPGTAPDTYQVISNHGSTPQEEFVSDDCGTTTEP